MALGALLAAVPWPFPVRPTLENLADPEARRLVATALMGLGGAVLLLTLAFTRLWARIAAVLVALVVTVTQAPSLGLLFVAATPGSYRVSPTGFSAASIAAGRAVFATTCAPCHGPAGDGVGGLGQPADLRRPHIWTHPAGDLFWKVSHGIAAPDGSALMPAFETMLDEPARWSVIDYVRAMNAGAAARGRSGWPAAVPAPPIALTCATLAARSIADLRGKAVRVILGEPPVPLTAVPPVNGIPVVTVWMPDAKRSAAAVAGVDCVARDGALIDGVAVNGPAVSGAAANGAGYGAAAYAILAGSADGRVIPARLLIDPDGVLRSVWRKEDGEAWDDPGRLLEEVRAICTEPLTIGTGVKHEYHH